MGLVVSMAYQPAASSGPTVRPQLRPVSLQVVRIPQLARGRGRHMCRNGTARAIDHLPPLIEVFFGGLMPLCCLRCNPDQQVPLGVTRIGRQEGRLEGHYRQAEAGAGIHGRRIARLPRMGQNTQDLAEARTTRARGRRLRSGT